MKALLEKYLPMRMPEDGGAGGGVGASAGAGAAAGAAGAGGSGAAASAGSGAGAAGAAGAGDGAAAAAAQPYRPEGLDDSLFGKDNNETIDKLHKAVKGYRDRDAARVVPDKAEAYRAFDMSAVPDALKPHFEGLASDPLFDAVSKVAMEEKIPVATMQKLTQALYAQAAEAGILEAPLDVAAERAALLPEAAKNLPKAQQDAAIEARMQENEDFLKLLAKPGQDGKPQLDQKITDYVALMLMDKAEGNQFLEFFRAQMTGAERAAPFNGQGNPAGADSKRDALRQQLAAPEMQPQHPKFDRAKYEALDAEYKKLFPG